MIEQSVEFIAKGAARDVAHAVEQFAHAQGRVSAIVVPWEGTATTVSMSVTAVRADGWAIEHLNLGTITLTDRADGTTAVALAADESYRGSAPDPWSPTRQPRWGPRPGSVARVLRPAQDAPSLSSLDAARDDPERVEGSRGGGPSTPLRSLAPDEAERHRLASLLDRFAQQLQRHFETGS